MTYSIKSFGRPMYPQNTQFRGYKPKNNSPVSNTAGMPPREPVTKSANMSPEEQLKQLQQEQLDSIKQQDEQKMLDRMTDETIK